MADPWPWPADDALTRARRVAREYRERLRKLDPAGAEELDGIVSRLGQTWVEGVEIVDEPVLSTSEAADYLAMTPRGVRMAVQRGGLVSAGQDGDGYLFLRADLNRYLATRRDRDVAQRHRSPVPS